MSCLSNEISIIYLIIDVLYNKCAIIFSSSLSRAACIISDNLRWSTLLKGCCSIESRRMSNAELSMSKLRMSLLNTCTEVDKNSTIRVLSIPNGIVMSPYCDSYPGPALYVSACTSPGMMLLVNKKSSLSCSSLKIVISSSSSKLSSSNVVMILF